MERLKDLKIEESLGLAKKVFDWLYLGGLFFIVCSEIMRTISVFPNQNITVTILFMEFSPYILPLLFFRFILSGAIKFNAQSVTVFSIMMAILYYTNLFHTASDDNIIMLSLLVGGVNIPWRRIVKTVFAAQFLSVVLVPILYFAGVTATNVDMIYRTNGLPRYSIGFLHPNQIGMQTFMMIGLFFVLYINKLRIWHFLVAEVIAVVGYFISYARSGLLFITLMIVAFAVYTLVLRKKNFDLFDVKPIKLFATLIFPIFAALSFLYIPLAASKTLDDFSSLRFSYSARAMNEMGFQFITLNADEFLGDILLDNVFLNITFYHGVLFIIVYAILFTLLQKRLVKVNHPMALYICTLLCYCMIDHPIIWGGYAALAPLMLSDSEFLVYNEGKPLKSYFTKKHKPVETVYEATD
ncbi:MAG: hypothetical protein LBL87_01890 [Ruminococcus sp.]|nr:hypothetical protein [Ruminococcus sp.]